MKHYARGSQPAQPLARKSLTRWLSLLALLGLWSGVSFATPVRYSFDIVFDCLSGLGGGSCASDVGGVHTGTPYTGYFSVSSDVLSNANGIVSGGVESFYFALADVVWDSTRPCNTPGGSDYCGSRGIGGFGTPLTLDIQNGQVLGICCSAFGPADFPFVDVASGVFSGAGDVAFVTAYYRDFQICPGSPAGCRIPMSGTGSFAFQQVSEPAELAMSALGFLALAIAFRRRRAS